MSTRIRPELAKDNKYYISKHRYYELKHFCLQYKDWEYAYENLCNHVNSGIRELGSCTRSYQERQAAVRQRYLDRMDLVKKLAYETDSEIGFFIFKAVTEDLSYTYLRMTLQMPCCKDMYYDRYRRFFWLLDKRKGE